MVAREEEPILKLRQDSVESSISRARDCLLSRGTTRGWVGRFSFLPDIEIPLTVAYVALLDYLGIDNSAKRKAQEYLLSCGDKVEEVLHSDTGPALTFAPFIRLLKNRSSVEPPMPPGAAAVIGSVVPQFIESYAETQVGNEARFTYWTQQIFYAYVILYLIRTGKANKTSEVVKNLERIILNCRTDDGGFFGLPYPGTIWGIVALTELGYPSTHPIMLGAVKCLKGFQEESGSLIIFRLPVWDTAWSLLALEMAGVEEDNPLLKAAAQYLVTCRGPIDSTSAEKNSSIEKMGFTAGGWGFSEQTKWFADIDDTALAIAALRRFMPDYAKEASRILLETQERDGGWATYIKGMGPFGKKSRWRTRDEFKKTSGSLFFSDPTIPDVSSHALLSLARVGLTTESQSVRKAIDYFKLDQEDNGSWLGMWAWLYIYGTSQVLWSLNEIRANMNASWIRRAVDWLKKVQNPDGGWGEGDTAMYDPAASGVGISSPVTTAWALTGLISAGEDTESDSVRRAVEYLVDTQERDGSWKEEGSLNLLYGGRYSDDLHGIYFPLIALCMLKRQTSQKRKDSEPLRDKNSNREPSNTIAPRP